MRGRCSRISLRFAREVRSRGGRWYDMRIRPYRTMDEKIDGVVITFVDISERHMVEATPRSNE